MRFFEVGIFLMLFIPGVTISSEKELNLNNIQGEWGWGNCENNKHKIKKSQNNQFLEFTVEKGTYYYYIAGQSKNGIKVILINEDRFDDSGNLVYWYIVPDGNNKYYWLRSDRKQNDLRGPIIRCKI